MAILPCKVFLSTSSTLSSTSSTCLFLSGKWKSQCIHAMSQLRHPVTRNLLLLMSHQNFLVPSRNTNISQTSGSWCNVFIQSICHEPVKLGRRIPSQDIHVRRSLRFSLLTCSRSCLANLSRCFLFFMCSILPMSSLSCTWYSSLYGSCLKMSVTIWLLFTGKVIDYRFRFLQSIRSTQLEGPSSAAGGDGATHHGEGSPACAERRSQAIGFQAAS